MASEHEISEGGFAMLRAAVDLARHQRVRSVEEMRAALLRDHPTEAAAIEEAITTWRRYVQAQPLAALMAGR